MSFDHDDHWDFGDPDATDDDEPEPREFTRIETVRIWIARWLDALAAWVSP